MFEAFQKALDQHHRPYLLLKGDKESRLKKAVEAIDAILANNTALYSYSDSLKNE
jgi:hypothetical protein